MDKRDEMPMPVLPDARRYDGSASSRDTILREIAVNGLGLAVLAAVVALGSYTLAAERRPIYTSVSAYAAENGLEYRGPEPAYGRLSATRRAGTGGNGSVDGAPAVR